jgi:uncharacterized protein YcbK (DUF882 family)
MKLSDHFTLAELTRSDYAARHGIDNTPGPLALNNLKRLAEKLEKVRLILGRPVFVSSGYRSEALNKAVGGSKTSAHLVGNAADITSPEFGPPAKVLVELREFQRRLLWDQLILEFPKSQNGGWVHIGFSDSPRGQVLTYDGKSYEVLV